MSNEPLLAEVLEIVSCPECGSGVWSNAKRCWLCGHAMDSPFKGQASREPVEVRDIRPLDGYFNLGLAIMAVTLVLVTAGVWMQEPILGICLAAVLIPAVGTTLTWGAVARLAGKPLTAAKRFGVFLTSALVTFAVAMVTAAIAIVITVIVVFAAIVAMFIALFEACVKMMGGG